MSAVIDRLEELAARAAQPENLTDAEIEEISRAWGEAVTAVTAWIDAGEWNEEEGGRARERLWAVVGKLPEIQKRLAAMKSDAARRLNAETRRVQGLNYQKSPRSPQRSVHRKA